MKPIKRRSHVKAVLIINRPRRRGICGGLDVWLLAKLLDGQIKEGPGRGFWGPVCIDYQGLPLMLSYERRLNEQRKLAQDRLKEKPADKQRQQAANRPRPR